MDSMPVEVVSRELLQMIGNGFTACFVVNRGRADQAIVLLEKNAWTEEGAGETLSGAQQAEKTFNNDIYSAFSLGVADRVKATTISPCTDMHIAKYSPQSFSFVTETREMYENITKQFAANESLKLDWVDNILSGLKEKERVLLSADEYILLPDMKWDGTTMAKFHLLLIFRDRLLKSIRDLRGDLHIDLLRKINKDVKEFAAEKYNVRNDVFRMYFHYQPTYYQLHLHINMIASGDPAPTAGIMTEKAHLLDTVINNLLMMPDYYQKASLTFALRHGEKLYQLMGESGAA